MRKFVNKLYPDGRIQIPKNIREINDLYPGDWIELEIVKVRKNGQGIHGD